MSGLAATLSTGSAIRLAVVLLLLRFWSTSPRTSLQPSLGPHAKAPATDVVHGRLPTGRAPDGLDRDVLDDLDKLAKACLEADRAGDWAVGIDQAMIGA